MLYLTITGLSPPKQGTASQGTVKSTKPCEQNKDSEDKYPHSATTKKTLHKIRKQEANGIATPSVTKVQTFQPHHITTVVYDAFKRPCVLQLCPGFQELLLLGHGRIPSEIILPGIACIQGLFLSTTHVTF